MFLACISIACVLVAWILVSQITASSIRLFFWWTLCTLSVLCWKVAPSESDSSIKCFCRSLPTTIKPIRKATLRRMFAEQTHCLHYPQWVFHCSNKTERLPVNRNLLIRSPLIHFQARSPALPIGRALSVITISLYMCMYVQILHGGVTQYGEI